MMISRRALLVTGAALSAASALSGCGSSGPAPTPAELPDYSGQGGTTAFDGAWTGFEYSDWQLSVKDGVFSGTGQGRGLSSWRGAITGFIRKDHSVEGSARGSGDSSVFGVTGTWPRLSIQWDGGDSARPLRLTRAS
jgi:hypothetical protein